MYGGRFLGMIGSVVDLQFLIRRLQEVSRGGLDAVRGRQRKAGWSPLPLRAMRPVRT